MKEADKTKGGGNTINSLSLSRAIPLTVVFDYEKYQIGFSQNYTFP